MPGANAAGRAERGGRAEALPDGEKRIQELHGQGAHRAARIRAAQEDHHGEHEHYQVTNLVLDAKIFY